MACLPFNSIQAYTLVTQDVPGAVITEIDDINNSGVYSGRATNSGFIYDGNSYTMLDAPGSSINNAYGINNLNHVVGRTFIGGSYHGFYYDGNGFTIFDAPTFPFSQTFAYGVNDSGTVVGNAAGGFIYDVNTAQPVRSHFQADTPMRCTTV